MKIFNFNMPEQLRDRLFAEKDRTGLSVSEITRRALDDYLETKEAKTSPSGTKRSTIGSLRKSESSPASI